MADGEDGAGLTAAERYFARMARAQTFIAATAMVVSLLALYATWEQARASRAQLEAAVWPRVMTYYNTGNTERGERAFEFVLANQGVGPARVVAARFLAGGEPITGYGALLDRLPGDGRPPSVTGFIQGRVLRPGERFVALGLPAAEDARRLGRIQDTITFEICYCSVLDRCWIATETSDEDGVREVGECPDYGAAEWQN